MLHLQLWRHSFIVYASIRYPLQMGHFRWLLRSESFTDNTRCIFVICLSSYHFKIHSLFQKFDSSIRLLRFPLSIRYCLFVWYTVNNDGYKSHATNRISMFDRSIISLSIVLSLLIVNLYIPVDICVCLYIYNI